MTSRIRLGASSILEARWTQAIDTCWNVSDGTEVRSKDQSPTAEERRLRAEEIHQEKKATWERPLYSRELPTHPAPNTASTTIAKTSTPFSERSATPQTQISCQHVSVGKKDGKSHLHGMLHKGLSVEEPLEQHLPGSHGHLHKRRIPSFSIAHFKGLKLNHWVSRNSW